MPSCDGSNCGACSACACACSYSYDSSETVNKFVKETAKLKEELYYLKKNLEEEVEKQTKERVANVMNATQIKQAIDVLSALAKQADDSTND